MNQEIIERPKVLHGSSLAGQRLSRANIYRNRSGRFYFGDNRNKSQFVLHDCKRVRIIEPYYCFDRFQVHGLQATAIHETKKPTIVIESSTEYESEVVSKELDESERVSIKMVPLVKTHQDRCHDQYIPYLMWVTYKGESFLADRIDVRLIVKKKRGKEMMFYGLVPNAYIPPPAFEPSGYGQSVPITQGIPIPTPY